uniref:Uncharacterized protein n=1 Tax=viral metagenome TaxID=1070528 RepID=A0A6C0IET8_9ZZZZ
MDLLKTGIDSIFVLSVIGFFVFLILLYVHYNVTSIFPFIPNGYTLPPADSMITSQTRSMNSEEKVAPEINGSALTFDKITNFKYENFTISFDVYFNGEYRNSSSPRVILYFANNPLTPISLPEDSTLVSSSANLYNTNFIVYGDPVVNDLNIAVVTGSTITRVLELAETIKNVPIKKPFKITLIVGKTFIEVYKDKKLVKTYRYQGVLDTASATGTKLYSPITNIVGDTIKIGNVQYFDSVIRSDQVRVATNEIKSDSFFK